VGASPALWPLARLRQQGGFLLECTSSIAKRNVKARYRYRFYPNHQQRQALAQLFGCVRVAWNDALAACRGRKYLGFAQLCRLLAQSKKTEERRWLSDVSSVPLSQAIRFEPFSHMPQQARVLKASKQGFSLKGDGVYLAKIGIVKPIWSRPLPSEPTSVTVIKDAANRYFLSFVVEEEAIQIPAENQSVLNPEASPPAGGRELKGSKSGMLKNRKLARAISLQGWRLFRQLCEAKAQRYSRDFRVISRWEPSSQICSRCGYR